MKENNKWLVVYVSSRQEKVSNIELEKRGIESYLPVSKRLRQWSDRKKWVEFPLFNGYLFVRPEPNQIDEVLSVQGIVCYLTFERKHAVIRDKEIEIIRKIENTGYYAESMMNSEDFSEGEKCLVTEGPLKGQTVDLIRKNNERIFLIAFDTLGQSIKINIPYEFLKKIKSDVVES